jgi:hypothetical protein
MPGENERERDRERETERETETERERHRERGRKREESVYVCVNEGAKSRETDVARRGGCTSNLACVSEKVAL